jgi:hypothetical protein
MLRVMQTCLLNKRAEARAGRQWLSYWPECNNTPIERILNANRAPECSFSTTDGLARATKNRLSSGVPQPPSSLTPRLFNERLPT